MQKEPHSLYSLPRLSALAAAALLTCHSASAFEFDTGNEDLKIRWDNTVKYSASERVQGRSPGLSQTQFGPRGVVGPNNINQDDGDNNFDRGLVSSRMDLFSEVDLSYRNWGARVSGAAWYDQVYNRPTDNRTQTSNHIPASEFTDDTRRLMGRDGELLDAFVYGNFDLADRQASFRLGRHTLLWGESLFFGANGIAGGQAPVDLIKLLSVPNSQFKEIARPTGKVSGQMQLTNAVTLGGYVGYEWEATRMMPVGSYLSSSDALGPGAERINAGPTGTFVHTADQTPSDGGQGGLQLRYRADAIDTDLGLYAIRFNSYTPANLYTTLSGFPPGLSACCYRWVYAEGIRAFGASFSKSIDQWGLAGEVSFRDNMPLSSSAASVIPSIGVGTSLNSSSNPGYAVGRTAHAQFSWIASLEPNFVARESSLIGEIAWNRRLSVTEGEQFLNPNADRDAAAIRTVYAPTYRQVTSGWDLTPSIGVGYTAGRSSALGPAFGPDKGGDVTVGLTGTYLNRWIVSLSYVHYYGSEGPTLDNNSNAQFKQSLADRDYVSFSVRTTF